MPSANTTVLLKRRAPTLYAIIALKLGKALLVGLLALGFFTLIGQDIDAQFDRLLRWIQIDPEQQFWAHAGDQLQKITPENLRWLGSGSLLYSVLLFVESSGLIRRASWAMWLAIGETAFFIPIEVLDLLDHFSAIVTVILVLNLIIVAYLVRNRDKLFRHHHPHPAAPTEDDAPAAEI